MGTYFNPGNESFRSDSNSRIYVDKTGLLDELNQLIGTSDRCVALSHARRFGKSQAADMISAYYSCGCDSRELFSKFEIAKAPDFEKYLNQYNVIHVDVSTFFTDRFEGDVVECIWDPLYRELKEVYPALPDKSEIPCAVLADACRLSGREFVIILDEWDCVIRNFADKPEMVNSYLKLLHALFKSAESKHYLALAYITGILPIKITENESGMNNFREFTMLTSHRFTQYFGFTEEEVKVLCDKYDMEYESLKKWYGGYRIDGAEIYNPYSVCCALTKHSLEPYWHNFSSFEIVTNLIARNIEGLKDDISALLEGERVFVYVGTFLNDFSVIHTKFDVLTALIHLGYLGYDQERECAFIPNSEVSLALRAALNTEN